MSAKRYELNETQWARIRPLLPGKAGDPGRSARDNRLFVDGCSWVLRSGAHWCDLPKGYGKWKTEYRRFSRCGAPSRRRNRSALASAARQPRRARLRDRSTRPSPPSGHSDSRALLRPEVGRRVDPAPAGLEHMDDAADHAPVVDAGLAARGGGKMRRNFRELRVCQPRTGPDSSEASFRKP